MMHEPEKSDPCIVAMKSANGAAKATSESMERRQGPRGTRAGPARTGHRAGQACHRDLTVYESEQDSRRRNGSLLCFTTSMLIYSR